VAVVAAAAAAAAAAAVAAAAAAEVAAEEEPEGAARAVDEEGERGHKDGEYDVNMMLVEGAVDEPLVGQAGNCKIGIITQELTATTRATA
jgi:hypothetical protein